MILGIDASNLRRGGGLTHITEILKNVAIEQYCFDSVVIWGADNLNQIPEYSWLNKQYEPFLEKSFIARTYWKVFVFPKKIQQFRCNLIFSPGGYFISRRVNYVSMSRNMLLFESKERNRFPFSLGRLRYLILNILQSISFLYSKGNIFISNYAQELISSKRKYLLKKPFSIINHGVSKRFENQPRTQIQFSQYSEKSPYKLLYISTINYYKHQFNLIKAIEILIQEGYPLEIHFVGGVNEKLKESFLTEVDKKKFVIYHGQVDYFEIDRYYKDSDGFIFASTCENMPNILVEAMSSGLPIMCSKYGPMPEILKDGGIYFDPLVITDIVANLREFLENHEKRQLLANKSFDYSRKFSWKKCSEETFSFLSKFV